MTLKMCNRLQLTRNELLLLTCNEVSIVRAVLQCVLQCVIQCVLRNLSSPSHVTNSCRHVMNLEGGKKRS